jgi:hypothetical protein
MADIKEKNALFGKLETSPGGLEILQGGLVRITLPFILVQDPDLDSVQPESRSKSAALPIITEKKKMCSPQQERSKTNI